MGRVDPALLALAIDSAQGLVAHGCLDGVMIEFGNDDGNRSKRAIELMAEAVFLADLSSERTELSALKFLLTTGCRTMQFPPPTDTSGAGGMPCSGGRTSSRPYGCAIMSTSRRRVNPTRPRRGRH